MSVNNDWFSTNITIITIIFAVSIALFGFVLAFLISSILTKDQVAADKRLDELKKMRATVKILL